MKRIATLLLAIALVFGAFSANLNVCAETEPYNYFDMEAISPRPVAPCKGTRVFRTKVEGESAYSVTGINFRYNSLGFDILPAVKQALGTKDYARITVSFEIKADWTDEFAGHTATCKPILRCMGPRGTVYNASIWNEEYKNALVGSTPIFADTDGKNIIGSASKKRVLLSDSVWVTFSTDMLVDRQQVYCSMTPDWTFCFDEMNGAHQPTEKETDSIGQLKIFDSVTVKNVSVCLSVNQSTPTPKPTAVPTVKPTAKITPAAEAPTQAPDNNPLKDDSDNSIILFTVIGTVIGAIVGASVSVIAVMNKKKKQKETDNSSNDVFSE